MKIMVVKLRYKIHDFGWTAQRVSKNGKNPSIWWYSCEVGAACFGTTSFGCDEKQKKKAFFLLWVAQSGGEGFRIGMVILLSRVKTKHNAINAEEELPVLQYVECASPMHEIDK